MDISNHASKFNQWKDTYNWDTCKTNRKEFGQFIAQFLTSESRVINLNGIYGSGKTEFIRRLYTELAKRNHPVVYIDVWESDFSNNPLAVICSELLEQVEYVFKEKAPNGKAKDRKGAVAKFNDLKSKLGICLKYFDAAAAFTDEPLVLAGTKAVTKIVEATPNLTSKTQLQKFTEEIQKNHIASISAVKDIKNHITYLSELIEIIYELNIPIVILIDELDRCRPNYAVEVLEVIKHFFETKGCTFLVATNTEVLEHSVKSIYGSGFDAKLYLRRFFDRKITLPPIPLVDYLLAKDLDFSKYKNLLLYPFTDNQRGNINFFANLFESNEIELRGIEQILNRFFTSLDYVSARTAVCPLINTVVLIIGLIEQHLDKQENRKNISHASFSIKIQGASIIGSPLKAFVDSMFECVTITNGKKCFAGGVLTTYPEQRVMLRIQSRSYSEVKLDNGTNIGKLISEMINHKDSESCNYWMWEDYQKIIDLSGHIE
ncbi:P-loop NTPase fold protein [Pseudoalteromonas sp. P1-11]|uniref:KAP family P-loop NTPase fold protein n=1 Tax=Pseudoalteromonas sp. P1-11 TaxID=1715254 RepID=UPI0006DC228D|nr:P-loop NTPase fold protein [Pseudoalteromonas sp. P1-11]KPW02707.1 KAP family P-loop domain protein [Pseudoalteromonas sp. P1-11]